MVVMYHLHFRLSTTSRVVCICYCGSDVRPLVLCFRVKYYPSDPLMLKEELTRYCTSQMVNHQVGMLKHASVIHYICVLFST